MRFHIKSTLEFPTRLKKWTENWWQQQDHLDTEQNKKLPTSKEELWDDLQGAWRTIPEDNLKK